MPATSCRASGVLTLVVARSWAAARNWSWVSATSRMPRLRVNPGFPFCLPRMVHLYTRERPPVPVGLAPGNPSGSSVDLKASRRRTRLRAERRCENYRLGPPRSRLRAIRFSISPCTRSGSPAGRVRFWSTAARTAFSPRPKAARVRCMPWSMSRHVRSRCPAVRSCTCST